MVEHCTWRSKEAWGKRSPVAPGGVFTTASGVRTTSLPLIIGYQINIPCLIRSEKSSFTKSPSYYNPLAIRTRVSNPSLRLQGAKFQSRQLRFQTPPQSTSERRFINYSLKHTGKGGHGAIYGSEFIAFEAGEGQSTIQIDATADRNID